MRNTLLISDLHAPYHHKDAIDFISACSDLYDCQKAISVGDIVDNHYPGYHEIEFGTYSNDDELKYAKQTLHIIESMFPDLIITLGNHDTMSRRKAKTAGLPEGVLRAYNDIYELSGGWKWVEEYFFKINEYQNCLVTHSIGTNLTTNAKNFSHCSVQGHHHSVFGVEYYADCNVLRWAMGVGCLIDIHAPAFNYGRRALKRPVVGLGAIIEDLPIIIPMQLTKSGRWSRKLGGYIYE